MIFSFLTVGNWDSSSLFPPRADRGNKARIAQGPFWGHLSAHLSSLSDHQSHFCPSPGLCHIVVYAVETPSSLLNSKLAGNGDSPLHKSISFKDAWVYPFLLRGPGDTYVLGSEKVSSGRVGVGGA